MTDKPYILGRGRLYFGDRLLGEVVPNPEDPVAVFVAKGVVEAPGFGRWIHTIATTAAVGYNPQRLLSDQRSPEKKRADDIVERYRKSFPDMSSIWADLTRNVFKPSELLRDEERLSGFYDKQLGEPYVGGTVTGRWEGRRFPAMVPREEYVLPNDHPFVATDFRKLEERVIAHYVKPITVSTMLDTSRFTEALGRATKATRRFAQQMEVMSRRVGEQVQRTYDRRIMIELFGHVDLDKPEPQFARERRIARLLKSRDPRQKKRGERLFLDYRRNRPGINYRKD